MDVTQVFEYYRRLAQSPADTYPYCPGCGARSQLGSSGRHHSHRCPQCGYVLYRNPAPGVVALIIDNDRVLLGKRALDVYRGGKWSLPGGFIEFHEDFLSAAHREIMEETGLSIKIQSIVSVVSNFLKPDLHTLVIVLLARKTGGDLCPGDDTVELDWFPLSGPFPEMAFSADTHVIERYHETRISGAPIDPRFATSESR